jgi:hypothetical protein
VIHRGCRVEFPILNGEFLWLEVTEQLIRFLPMEAR